jgi:hypothetical protein
MSQTKQTVTTTTTTTTTITVCAGIVRKEHFLIHFKNAERCKKVMHFLI